MWIIFALGLPGVGAAGRFAWRGEHQLGAFLRWLTFTLFATGLFGFCVGEQMVFQAITAGPGEAGELTAHRLMILFIGTREAMNCISGALMFIVVMGALVAIGHRRFPLPNPAAVPR
jgi:hypothetical protein